METVRCANCALFCGENYGTEHYLLDAESYCSINCYKTLRAKEELDVRPRSEDQGTGRKPKKHGKRKPGTKKKSKRA